MTGGRALRAYPPAPGQGNLGIFDTRDSSFRVLSLPSNGGLSALFLPNRRGHAPLKPEQQPCPQAARRSHRTPDFSCVLTAASVSTRINTRYQADNRCRQRHRVRKAVFVQLVCIGPKAFCNVIRSSQ